MNIHPREELFPILQVDLRNSHSGKNLNGRLARFGSAPRNQELRSIEERRDFYPDVHLGQLAEALSRSAVIEERNRMAREIHDTLAQDFAGILLHLEAAYSTVNSEPDNAFECLARAKELAKCGLEDARRMLLGLRPKSLEGARLPDALKQLAERFERDCGIECVFSMTGRAHGLSEGVDDEMYRVAQEALCNVRKHSRAACVTVLLGYRTDGVTLEIKDNGRGFAATQYEPGAHGFGLLTMRERARNLGGKLDINAIPGRGTELKMRVPASCKSLKKRNHL